MRFSKYASTALSFFALLWSLGATGIIFTSNKAYAQEPQATPQTPEKVSNQEEDIEEEEKNTGVVIKLPEQRAVISPETFRMIEMIEKKNRELQQKEEELKNRELQLKKLELKLREDLQKINLALAKSDEQLGLKDERTRQNIDSLIKVYSSMKPEEAASILEALDEDLAIKIISGMKSQTAGQVLSQLNVKIAKTISERLAGKILKDDAK
jgi:flagellar motility protein MotE (MotC chaperone)